MEYFLIFVLSIFISSFADKYFNRPKLRNICIILSLLPPIILAALRAHTVGTDVDFYITPTYEEAKRSPSLLAFIKSTDKEWFFWGLQYLIAKVFGSLFSVHLVNQTIIMLPVMCFFVFLKKHYQTKIWQMYAIYLFFDYNLSLCVIRQNVAFSIFLFGFVFLLRKKYILFLIFTIIAGFMHNSTIIPILLFTGLYFTRNIISTYKGRLILIIVLVLLVYGYQYFLDQFSFLIDDMYISRMEGADNNSGGLLTLFFYFILAALPFISRKHIFKDIFFINYMPAIGLAFNIIARSSVYIGRLSIPFMLMICITIPLRFKKVKILYYGILLLIIGFWYVTYIDRGDWETYPYMMDKRMNLF